MSTLRKALNEITFASDDGTEHQHNEGCQGEPNCPACWVLMIRRALAEHQDHPIDLAEVKAEAIRDAANAQRTLANEARTRDGKAEHEDIADWLDDRAAAISPSLEGAHP